MMNTENLPYGCPQSAEVDHDPPGCAAMIHPGTYYDQPSYCDDDVVPGSDYCAKHREWYEHGEL